jgi:glycosyltransferase involved in cell wall biosynthesis
MHEMTSPADQPWPVTVVIPTRHESGNIQPLLERMPPVDKVLFVDDSDDDTPDAIQLAAGSADMKVELLHRPPGDRPGGLSGAVVAGLALVESDWMCVMDGDLQHPPEVIGRLMARATDDVDLIIASRKNWDSINEGLGPVRRFVSWVFGRIAVVLLRSRIGTCSDPLSGFFLVRTSALDPIRFNPTGFKILLEILVTHPDLRRAEVGFAFARRGSGESNGSVREAGRYLRHVIRLRRRLRTEGR